MTATLDTMSELDFDWRQQAICDDSDDRHFDSVQDLMDDGMTHDQAVKAHAVAETAQKAKCFGCPVIRQCLDYAMGEEIEYGVWGGKGPGERIEHRPRWVNMRGLQAPADLRVDSDLPPTLHPHPGHNLKFQQRLARAKAARDILYARPDFSVDGGSEDGTITAERAMRYANLVIENPSTTGAALAKLAETSTTRFNRALALTFEALKV